MICTRSLIIIVVKGQANGGVYQFAVRAVIRSRKNGIQISPVGPMGVAIAIGFQPTGGGKAAITGISFSLAAR